VKIGRTDMSIAVVGADAVWHGRESL